MLKYIIINFIVGSVKCQTENNSARYSCTHVTGSFAMREIIMFM